MTIAFVHFSDLLFASGSAVIYRRVLALLARETPGLRIVHLAGPHRSQADNAAISASYPPEIKFHPLPPPPAHAFLARLHPGLAHTLSVRHHARHIARSVANLRPSLLWWSADYPALSHAVLNNLLTHAHLSSPLPPIHLGVMDPPELFRASPQLLALHRASLRAARSLDTISENLRARLLLDSGDPAKLAVLLNDFVPEISWPRPVDQQNLLALEPPPLVVAIAGRMYGAAELQTLLDLLPAPAELHWYGDPFQRKWADQLRPPPGVVLRLPAPISRDLLPAHLARTAHLGYLSMPADRPEFSRYSIPTKLVTYLEAGLPVAFHAPADSEIHSLNQQFHFGSNLALAPDPAAALRALHPQRQRHLDGLRALHHARHRPETLLAAARRILSGA